jgi:hypothetical protein
MVKSSAGSELLMPNRMMGVPVTNPCLYESMRKFGWFRVVGMPPYKSTHIEPHADVSAFAGSVAAMAAPPTASIAATATIAVLIGIVKPPGLCGRARIRLLSSLISAARQPTRTERDFTLADLTNADLTLAPRSSRYPRTVRSAKMCGAVDGCRRGRRGGERGGP